MKKLMTLILVVTFLIVGCTNNSNEKQKVNYLTEKYITLDELDQKIEKEDDFIFAVVSKTCAHCIKFKNDLKDYKYQDTVYFLEASNISNDDLNRLLKKYPKITGTPTMFFYKKGKIIDESYGYDKDELSKKIESFYK